MGKIPKKTIRRISGLQLANGIRGASITAALRVGRNRRWTEVGPGDIIEFRFGGSWARMLKMDGHLVASGRITTAKYIQWFETGIGERIAIAKACGYESLSEFYKRKPPRQVNHLRYRPVLLIEWELLTDDDNTTADTVETIDI